MENFNVNKCKAFINFMLTQQQWSGINKQDIDKWFLNFRSLDTDEIKLVYKLLVNIIYFSEKDVTDALRYGVLNCLSYSDILEKQKETSFALSPKALLNIYNEKLNKSCFVPLLDSDSPHESGNSISRLLVQQGIVTDDCSMFIDKVPEFFKSRVVENLVIVDDCVGSGDQLTTFWTGTMVDDGEGAITIKELCEKYNVKANYLTLFGYNKNIDSLRDNFKDLNIHCVRLLNDSHRVFSDLSYVWESKEERDSAFSLFESLTKNAGIPLLGYKELDFAFIMHRTIPDWSLPLFWKENNDWKLLLRRKNSNG
ncbi:MAG: hypothetical protein IJA43_02395 [Clostridia bacterium]|nr:hypothetical protein [Clostridia bacterium]